jgi:hypothetical protein
MKSLAEDMQKDAAEETEKVEPKVALPAPAPAQKNATKPATTDKKLLRLLQLSRLLSQSLRKKPRKKKKKSQWTKLPSRLIHPLLPMPPRTPSHKLQFNIIKLSLMRMIRFRPNTTHTTQTQWDP